MSLWMNLEQFEVHAGSGPVSGWLARLSRFVRARERGVAEGDDVERAYAGPERRSGTDRRSTPRRGPDRRRGRTGP